MIVYQSWPLSNGKILLRVENIAYKFDPVTQSVKYVDVNQLASNIYVSANSVNITAPVGVQVHEVSISDNMPIDNLMVQKRAFRWRGDDDDKIQNLPNQPPADKEGLLAFEPQRIR